METKAQAEVGRLKARRNAAGLAPTDDVAAAMNGLLADVFALYLKTKNFRWHMNSPRDRGHHVLFDEQSAEVYAMADPIAGRIRERGGASGASTGHGTGGQRIRDNDADHVEPADMLAELCEDNKMLATCLRAAHGVCHAHRDSASAGFIEVWIDETERRTGCLLEAGRPADATGH
jgi:starvation-inducible DNA-binding protein